MPDFPAIGHVAVTVKDLGVSRPRYRAPLGADRHTAGIPLGLSAPPG